MPEMEMYETKNSLWDFGIEFFLSSLFLSLFTLVFSAAKYKYCLPENSHFNALSWSIFDSKQQPSEQEKKKMHVQMQARL